MEGGDAMASREEIETLLVRTDVSDEELRQLGRRAVRVLIDIFRQDGSELRDRRRRMALHTLGLLGGKAAVEHLIATAEDAGEEGWLRRAALRSLGLAEDPRAVKYLRSRLDAEDFGVRKSAVLGLGVSPRPAARQALEEVRNSDDPRLARQAGRAEGTEDGGGEGPAEDGEVVDY
jgi:HEAT repeat protein